MATEEHIARVKLRRAEDVEKVADGVGALVNSVALMTEAVKGETAARNRRTIALVVIGIFILIPAVLASFFILKVLELEKDSKKNSAQTEELIKQNNELLTQVGTVSNPDAVAQRVEANRALVAQAILCIDNHSDRYIDPSVPLAPGCP